ncbi:TetR/AcrR family transcriptional regulator [Goodfellowiella coeruleoviolacea]|uniref:Transcriptional regulator, TetR family n=1 Tax=Goodfellowiella coeruleoviolacea TaxID=334858 RepID=A0AAE3GBS0_9PSEU|nr:TetR/AcrR family transcriptional regulator [Goodfellowiella coeruleoviolacea]MCP2164484.1 transcriptional regulator, TetR family [Goodfellowiella coeruleoviolacea]
MTETAGRRGRPRTFDRGAALAAATRLFWERGYAATSIGELTEAMGIRPGSLYAAFGDKRSLFREVVADYARSPNAGFVGVALAEEPTAHRAIARILREAAANYADPAHPGGCLIITAATNTGPQDAEVADFLRELRNTNLGVLQERLERARQDGELPADVNPRALAHYVATVVQGMSQRARDGASAAELAEVAELALAAWPGPRR